MQVDVGWMGTTAHDWFLGHTGKVPNGFRLVDQRPVVQQSVIGERRIGVVLFPAVQNDPSASDAELIRIADTLRAECDLVIGVSPWGTPTEREFLAAASGHYDVLLGSGAGGGMRGNMDSKGTILWARGYAKGKALAVLELMEWPRRTRDWEWKEIDNVRFPVVNLDDSVPPDPVIEAMPTP